MTKKIEEKKIEEKKEITCGLIMPISAIDGYTAEHWKEIKNILTDSIKSIKEYTIEVKLVSDADEIGVIQKRIVQNIYDSDIVVCDVSAKNPNVMFELGMRLAFDKPTVIVIDDKTGYSFDTGLIEHVGYPKDLRFQQVVDFKNKLANKVLATYKKSIESPEHSTFLKNFGKFEIAKLEETTVPANTLMINMLSDLQRDVNKIKNKELIDNTVTSRNRIHRAYKNNNEVMIAPLAKYIIGDYLQDNEISSTTELINNQKFKNYLKDSFKLNNIEYKEIDFLPYIEEAEYILDPEYIPF